MVVTFPVGCITDASRMAWCHRAQEKLRLIHNYMGEWYKVGISETTYNELPNKVKTRYSYVPKLSQVDWDDFQAVVFKKVSNAIIEAMLTARQEAIESTFWNPDLDGDVN